MHPGSGLGFIDLRDTERAAEAMGINLRLYKTVAFAISAAMTGAGGVLFAHHNRYVSTETFGDTWLSVDFLTAVVVGGQASLFGAGIGAAFVALVPYYLGELRDFAYILNGVALIAVLLFAPDAIAGALARGLRWPGARRRPAAAVRESTSVQAGTGWKRSGMLAV